MCHGCGLITRLFNSHFCNYTFRHTRTFSLQVDKVRAAVCVCRNEKCPLNALVTPLSRSVEKRPSWRIRSIVYSWLRSLCFLSRFCWDYSVRALINTSALNGPLSEIAGVGSQQTPPNSGADEGSQTSDTWAAKSAINCHITRVQVRAVAQRVRDRSKPFESVSRSRARQAAGGRSKASRVLFKGRNKCSGELGVRF